MLESLKNILENHGKLISMISPKILPIKESLLTDVKEMKHILEVANKKNKHNHKEK